MNWYGVITNEGKNLLAQQDKDNPLMITSATAGTGKVAEVALLAQMTLTDEKQTISIIQKKAENYSQIVTLRITSENLTEGYICNQIGLWAKIGEESPVLFALYQNDDGQSIPDYNNSPEFVWTFNAAIEVNNEAVINITADTKALVTKEELEVVTKVAAKAQNTADKVKTLAENVQNTADDAKTVAANAQSTADDAVTDINELKDEVFTKTKGGAVGITDTVTLDIGFTPKQFEIFGIDADTGVYLQWTKSNGWTGNKGPLYDYDVDMDNNTITISTHIALARVLIWRAFG